MASIMSMRPRFFFQKAIRNARHAIDAPPRDHKDWESWEPGHALGPYWGLKREFLAPPGPPSTPAPQTVQGPAAAASAHAPGVQGPTAAACATAPGPVLSPAPHTVPVQMAGVPMVSINVPGPTPMTVPAATPEPGGPWHVHSVQDYSTGAWTTGWWHDRGAGVWKWHEAS